MIVAPRARHRQAEKGFGKRVDLVVDKPHLLIEGVGGAIAVKHHAEVRRADRRFIHRAFGIEPGRWQEIARHVLAQQLIKGNVGIERPDQIIAIVRRSHDLRIPLRPVGVGVTDPVHPVPRPLLAEMRTGEEVIDERLKAPRLGDAVGPCGEIAGRRRQASHDKKQPAHQRLRRGVGCRLQPLLAQASEDKAID